MRRLHASGAFVNNNEKLIFFIYFRLSCTRNGDRLISLIKIDNAHKERILSQFIINTFKKSEGKFLNMMVTTQWLLAQWPNGEDPVVKMMVTA